MPRPPIWYLRKIDLFADLTDSEMMELIEGLTHCEYPAKHQLYGPGDERVHMYILKEGEVTLYQTVDGKRVVVDILKPGSVFGDIGFGSDDESTVHAELSQKSFVCILPDNFFLQLMHKRPDVALKAFSVLNKRIAQYQSQLRFLSTLDAKDRILATIKLLNQKEDHSILPPILRTPTKITHEKLAGMTGLTRETVTKQLQDLEKSGYLVNRKKHFRLTDQGNAAVRGIA